MCHTSEHRNQERLRRQRFTASLHSDLIDNGWRRSGQYLYRVRACTGAPSCCTACTRLLTCSTCSVSCRPALRAPQPVLSKTCCPPYTIRLPVNAFEPSRDHRRLVRRMAAYLSGACQTASPFQSVPVRASSSVSRSGIAAGACACTASAGCRPSRRTLRLPTGCSIGDAEEHQSFRTSEHQNVRTLEHQKYQNIRTSEQQNIRTSEH